VRGDGGGRLLSQPGAGAADSPFRGLEPFGDSDADGALFAGRDAEIELVVANLRAARLTILYGPSGVGKSSLLHAGAVRRIRAQASAAAATRAPAPTILLHDEWSGDPGGALARQIDVSAGIEADEPPLALDEAIERWGERRRGVLLLIFDQFEEYLRLHPEGQPDTLDKLLPEVVDRLDLRVHVLISLRDDALSELDRFEGRMPHLFDNYLRLPQMSTAAAREAIEKPIAHVNAAREAADRAPIEVEAELVDDVLAQLRDPQLSSIDPDAASGPAATADVVEPAFLQLVMQRLWNADAQCDPPVLRRSTLATLGGAAAIVRGHLDGAMSSLTAAQRDVAADVFGFLVTPSGAKIRYSADDLGSYAKRRPDEVAGVMNTLSHPALRIIRRVPSPSGDPGGQGFEIFHDVLAGAIRGWAQRMRSARLERRNTRLAAAVATLAAIAIALLAQGADSGALHRLELSTVDQRFALRGGHAPDPRIVVVGSDDRAAERGVTRAADADVLAKVVAGRPAVVAVAFEYDVGGSATNGGASETTQLKRAIGDASTQTHVLLGTSRVDNDGNTTLFGAELATAFEGAQAAYGDFPLDDDETVRRIEYEGRQVGAFASSGLPTIAVRAAEHAGAPVTRSDVPRRGAWIDFAGGRGSYPQTSFLDVLDGKVDPARFRDRIVVIGDTTTDTVRKSRRTAVEAKGGMAPLEWHANAIATMRAGQPLRDVPTALTVALIAGLALLASALALRLSTVGAFALSAGAGLLFLLAAQLAFNAGWVVAVVPALLALVVATVANPLVARGARLGGRGV